VKREPVTPEKRKAPTLKEQVAVLKKTALCFMCREPLRQKKQIEFDHAIPLALGGKHEVSNINALCASCHRRKTDSDLAIIAKSKRQAGDKGQYARRKKNGPQIQSRNTLGGEEYRARKEYAERMKAKNDAS